MNRPIKVEKESGQHDDNGKPIMVVDQELTAAAMQKADEIRQAFLDWIWTDDERRDMLTKLYNAQDNYMLRRTYFSKQVGSLGQSLYDEGCWHSTATVPGGVKLQRFATPEAAMEVARRDAIQRGFEGAQTQPVEIVTLETPAPRITYHSQLAGEDFRPTGSDFYGKNEYKLTIGADDGGIFDLRIFQSAEAKVGLRVQYEKNNLIDGTRTVHTHFDTLSEALECVSSYKNHAECQDNAGTLPAAPPPAGEKTEQESPRIRMR